MTTFVITYNHQRDILSFLEVIMKKVTFDDLVVGQKYYVECGMWSGNTVFCGSFLDGKRTKYRFTFGTLENWLNQWNIVSCKSNLKVYEL